ncbi:MAG: UDP-N-acetylmuramoyl-tripeptide--D-alanyl-D-alanine ligase [Firmicutes bacterium]|nr:UDP-N-acetylmuramoyl-tripeptide--D-alanyl-D-alanine ligase [Bacillota bacterium]
MLALQIVLSVITALLLFGLSIKFVHILQLEGYRQRNFVAWLFSKRFFPAIFSLNKKAKVPLRYTPRVIRLFVAINLLAKLGSFVVSFFVHVWYLPLLALALPVIVLLASVLMIPIEHLIKQKFIRRAQKKLFSKEHKDLIRIGIAGSFGKTTTKNILGAMLSEKYKVVTSPASFNTPMGFARTILGELKPDTEILIMEMGERYPGDIKEMCELFKPHHGIITSIGAAHLKTFKTVENARKEIYELKTFVSKLNGILINGDDDIKVEEFETKLLGKHNQLNLTLCAQMARELGVSDEQIKDAVTKIPPVPHRLEHSVAPTGVHILDDSYNSNPSGAGAALDVLLGLKNENKGSAIVMTPGMVELGEHQYFENYNFAKKMSSIADSVIIVGDTNKEAINSGLLDSGFSREKIFHAQNIDEAKGLFPTLLKSGDVLLIENDLPDNF